MSRIFIGLPISAQLQEEIIEWQQSFTTLPVRWLKPKNLHITLVPPWHTEDVSALIETVQSIRPQIKSFHLNFEQVSLGPDPRSPRLLWATGERVPAELLNLKRHLEDATGQQSHERSFELHLTLARFRPEDFDNWKIQEPISWSETVTSFVVMESLGNSEYNILSHIPL